MEPDYAIIITLALLCIIVVFLNSICIYVIAKTPTLHHHSVLAIANLLCCHLIQGAIVIPSYIVKRLDISDVSISGPACDVFRFSYMTTNYVACISLLLITVDRLCAIKWPIIYKESISNCKIAITMAVIWLYVLILCFLPFILGSGKSRSGCTYRPTKEWSIAMLTINTFLPLLLISTCYIVIFFTAWKSRKCASRKSQTAMALRIAKISSVVVSAFLVCWGPSFLFYILLSICPGCFSSSFKDSDAEQILTFVMKVLTFLDGVLAPLIYCLMHNGIRHGITLNAEHAVNVLRSRWKRKQQQDISTPTD